VRIQVTSRGERQAGEAVGLKAISGIGPKLEKVLNGLGIWTYGRSPPGHPGDRLGRDYLSLCGRIGRDDWARQAATLAAKK